MKYVNVELQNKSFRHEKIEHRNKSVMKEINIGI